MEIAMTNMMSAVVTMVINWNFVEPRGPKG